MRHTNILGLKHWYSLRHLVIVTCLILCWLSIAGAGLAQSPPPPGAPGAPRENASAGSQSQQQALATITGRIVDQTGHAVVGARVSLKRGTPSPAQEALSDDNGQFSFANVPPGPFQLSLAADGFATQESSGIVGPGETAGVPQITLALATEITQVHVGVSTIEIAQEQLKEQEQQRVLGVLPNFYVTYVPNAAPLTPKQKFGLALRSTVDPVSFGVNGAVAGIQQAANSFSGYGQGAEGYAKRYGASYADFSISTFIGGALLPSLLKQDPRYFYKGTGSKRSRILYAIANSVICKGDNGHWQANYSGIVGSLASGGISNLYYPAGDRSGAALAFENTAIGIGATVGANLIQEFLLRKLTPNLPNHAPAIP